MNNTAIEEIINECISEFAEIENIINRNGALASANKYLTLYSLIKACGVIEYSYKNIIADFNNSASTQVQRYIDITIRGSSLNPSLDNIRKLLKNFDESWRDSFNSTLDLHPSKEQLKQSLSSLNNNRNNFAHGQICDASFADIKSYFLDSVEIIKMVDSVVL